MSVEKCKCGCGSTKKHYANYICSVTGKRPSMIACDKFFKSVWAGEK